MVTVIDETYQLTVEMLLRKLIHLNHLNTKKSHILQLFNTLTHESLSYPITEELPPCSQISGDGTPIQFSVSLTHRNRQEIRYVTEICKPAMLLPARIQLTRKRIPKILELINALELQCKISEVLDLLLPTSHLSPDHSLFGVWVGVQHRANQATTLKLYCNLLWQIHNPYPTNTESKDIDFQKSLGTYCHPNSIGFEITTNSISKIKLYLRGYDLSWSNIQNFLHEHHLVTFEPKLKRFHEIILNKTERYYPYSVVLCIGIPEKINEFYDFKFEVGPQNYLKDDKEIHQRIIKFANEMKFNIKPYEQLLNVFSNGKLSQDTMIFHDVVGVGYTPHGEPRCSIYLKPYLTRYYKSTD
jgi:hypothetical protein